MGIGDDLVRPIVRALEDVPVHGRQLGPLIRGLKGTQRRNRSDVEDLDHYDGDASGAHPHGPDAGGDAEKRRGVDRGDARDDYGHFVGSENTPWTDKEKLGLQNYADDNDVEVVARQVRVDYEGSPQDGRLYDGLVRNDDGTNTYDGIEIKSGHAIDKYTQPGNTQYQFDNAVNDGTPARGTLDGNEIIVTRVIIREEP